jgi:hypothetical protein
VLAVLPLLASQSRFESRACTVVRTDGIDSSFSCRPPRSENRRFERAVRVGGMVPHVPTDGLP